MFNIIKTKKMNKEFIPYKEARLLKGLGFNEPCLRYYWEGATDLEAPETLNETILMGNNTNPKTNWELTDLSNSDLKGLEGTVFMTAPLYQQAFRWFRENGYHCGIIPRYDEFHYFIKDFVNNKEYDDVYNISSYEEAELACLRKLIEIIKNKENENNNQ